MSCGGVSGREGLAAPASVPGMINITVKHASVSSTLQTSRNSTVLSLKELISSMEEFGESTGLAVEGQLVVTCCSCCLGADRDPCIAAAPHLQGPGPEGRPDPGTLRYAGGPPGASGQVLGAGQPQ